MTFAGEFHLPPDLTLVPVDELPADLREKLTFENGDYALTRPQSRTPSQIVDARAADLIREFIRPTTLVQAILRVAQTHGTSAQETLVEACPLLERLLAGGFLVAEGASEGSPSDLGRGDLVGRWEIVATIQVVDDVEVHQVRDGHRIAVLKIERPGDPRPAAAAMREREARVLSALDGTVAPRLLEVGRHAGRAFLAIEWCRGIGAATYAEELRGENDRASMLELCRAIATAYAIVHAHGYVHGDVHPRNILVGPERRIALIDFGLAVSQDDADTTMERAGVAFYHEPELAAAFVAGRRLPPPSPAGEQYGVAALLYMLATGTHYADFSLERETMLRQIIAERPRPFRTRGVAAWPQLEAVLERALAKSPHDRFASMEEMTGALDSVSVPRDRRRRSTSVSPARSLLATLTAELRDRGALAQGPSTAPTASLFLGAAGVACALYRLAMLRDSAADLASADLWLTAAENAADSPDAFLDEAAGLSAHVVGTITPFHTASGVAAMRALISNAAGDAVAAREAAARFLRLARNGAGTKNRDLTLGRSGALLASALLGDMLPDEAPERSEIASFGGSMLDTLWNELDALAPIALQSEPPNLGIAHGWCGYIYATLRFCRTFGHPLPCTLRDRLNELADLAEPWERGARWHWNDSGPVGGFMSGWCNGSAGFVQLFTLAHRKFAEQRFLDVAIAAAWNAWEGDDGNGTLCCGEAGRAYALATLARHLGGETTWLARARRLADRAAVAIAQSSEKPRSLFKGPIGVALLAADLDRPQAAAFPFLEDEGWR